MNRREFVTGAAAFAAVGRTLGQDFAPTGVPEMDALQAEINEVTPADYRAYCQPHHGLDTYVPSGEPTLAALRRLDAAFEKVVREAHEVKVAPGARPAVWFVYNMGIVVKTAESLFSVDLNHRFAEKLADELDFALITHNHLDHYTQRFYETMDGLQHKTVVTNFMCNYGAYFKKKTCGGYTRGGKTFTFKDVTVKTSMSDHNAYLVDYTMPFEIDVGGYRIYHSGDSSNLDKLNPAPAPDLWFVHPYCGLDVVKGVQKFAPKKTLLVHLNELGHGKNRWRFTWRNGLTVKARVEAAGGEAHVPLWGERIA